MVGNASVPTVTLCILALHAAILTPHSIAAEEVSSIALNHEHKNGGVRSKPRKRRLRRHKNSRDLQRRHDLNEYDHNPPGQQQQQEQLRNDDERQTRKLLSDSCQRWFPDTVNEGSCTNNPDKINPLWLKVPPEIQDQLFRPTGPACCDAFFPGRDDCKLYPACGIDDNDNGDNASDNDAGSSSQTMTTNSCVSPGWYPDQTTRNGCSNGQTYQEDWLKPTMINVIFKPTYSECCKAFYLGTECQIYDVGCSIDPTKFAMEPIESNNNNKCESEWHPDVKMRSGCTNDPNDYPPNWSNSPEQKQKYFAPSAYDCCKKFNDLGGCDTRDVCKGDGIVRIHITERPTTPPQPTVSPTTRKPTSTPTTSRPSTPLPTNRPTSFIWLMRSGYCVQNSEVRKPSNDAGKMYSTFEACCSDSHREVRCTRDAPPPPTQSPTRPQPTISPTTFAPTITAAPVAPTRTPTDSPTEGEQFFIDHVTGSCTDAKATKVPHWITVIYTDYWICCDNSHARAQCIREGPKKGHSFEPTSRPSALESDVPSSQPSELHSHVPSGQPSAPTASPTTLYWGALRTFSAKPTQRPTVADCSDLSWHVDADVDQGCTNRDLSPTQNAVILFQTMEDCCEILFSGLDCAVNDQCQLTNSLLPAYQNLPGECNNDWHPIMSYPRDGCSTSLDIPSSWKQPENRQGLLFDTATECCQEHYIDKGSHCKLDRQCTTMSPTTNSPTPLPTPPVTYPEPIAPKPVPSMKEDATFDCDSAQWHLSMGVSEMACSNSLTYPAMWDLPVMKEKFLFENHHDCCVRFSFGNVDACGKHDVCISEVSGTSGVSPDSAASDICESAKWHMTWDFTKCSNSFKYPPTWLQFEDKYFSDNPAECCLKTFNYEDCEIEDICASSDAGQTTASSESATRPPPQTTTTLKEDTIFTITTTAATVANTINECSEKTRRQCFYSAGCLYDTTGGTCTPVLAASESITQHQFPNDFTSGTSHNRTSSPTQEPSTKPSSRNSHSRPALNGNSDECIGKPMRRCRDDPGCHYDVTSQTCTTVLAISQPTTDHTNSANKKTANSPTNKQLSFLANNGLDNCSAKPMRRCRDDPECKYDESSQTCSTVLMAQKSIAQPDIGGKPSDNSVAASPIICEEMSKKYCVREPECVWDKNGKSCDRLDQIADGVDERKQVAPTATEGCNGRMWHPKSLSDPTCSNSLDYPSIWNNPALPKQYLFVSFQQCCDAFYDGYCKKEDACG